MNKKKVFLTGGEGFIGKNFKELLSGKYIILSPSVHELDLLDYKAVQEYLIANNPDVVVHAAAVGVNRSTVDQQVDVLKNNLLMFYNLCACKKYFGRMIVFGSGAEYNKNNNLHLVEEGFFGKSIPTDDYGLSKFTMAKLAENIDNITHLRFFGVFGKYEDYRIRFISNAVCRKIMGLPITIKKNVFFDYIYIDDLIRIVDLFIENDYGAVHCNVGTGNAIDLLSLGKMVDEIGGGKKVGVLVTEEGLNNEYSCGIDRLLGVIGKFKFTPFEQAISKMFDYYKLNVKTLDKDIL